jgi:hypothetical protein
MAKESALSTDSASPNTFAKSRPKGPVQFPPFDTDLDPTSLHQVRRFRVHPQLTEIGLCCRHIPYNSGKKDFYEKTGRESFEGEFVVESFLWT